MQEWERDVRWNQALRMDRWNPCEETARWKRRFYLAALTALMFGGVLAYYVVKILGIA